MNRSFFVSDSLESRANHSHCSVLKSDESDFKMSDFERKGEERKSEFPTLILIFYFISESVQNKEI